MPFNAYGPLFNVLAPLVWVNPLANKLLFAFSYLVYVIWLIKDFAPRRGFVALSWPSVRFVAPKPVPLGSKLRISDTSTFWCRSHASRRSIAWSAVRMALPGPIWRWGYY